MSSTSVDAPMYGKLKKYMRKNRYQRLYPDYGKGNSYGDGTELLSSSRKKRYSNVARFGGDDQQPRKRNDRTWRMKVTRKLRLKKFLVTPVVRILARIKEAYVNMMLRVAGNAGALGGSGNGVFGEKRIPKARQVKERKAKNKSKKVSRKDEFENKLAYEIYKVMVASRQLEQQSANYKEAV